MSDTYYTLRVLENEKGQGAAFVNQGNDEVCVIDFSKTSKKKVVNRARLITKAPELKEALESTNKELEWAINEINRLHKVNHDHRDLDEPECIDMQTVHENMGLLAEILGGRL